MTFPPIPPSRYLDTNHKDRNLSTTQLTADMKRYMNYALGASLGGINARKVAGSFEIFGLDFMVDRNFRPWLIEVNTNPCLELCNSHLSSIIPPLIESGINRSIFGSFGKHANRWERLDFKLPPKQD